MPAGSHRFQVGSIACTVLSDGYVACPTPLYFPNADAARLFQALESRGLPQEFVLSPYTCLLIETGRHVLLIDTGGGGSSSTNGAIRARLEMAGIHPRDVDTVVITHAHPDHIGGAIDPRGRPAFPNARYVLSEFEHDFWMASRPDVRSLQVPPELRQSMAAGAREGLEPLRYQLEPIYRETELAPGIRAIPAPGHTPGHLAVLIASEGHRLLNIGDAAVHPLHLEQPEWVNGFDLATSEAVRTRRELMQRAVEEEMLVMAFHFPFPSVGRVAPREAGGWSWTPHES